ncbi:rhamnogalacturonan acetylesterase [Sphingobacterium suaedae]|uniref:Rhamnogalacturonan acetylesterase n=1 Tax=Sphingobacterium suaedae TaxID=1686402 RepID=A0ABW5KCT6_9SPHI
MKKQIVIVGCCLAMVVTLCSFLMPPKRLTVWMMGDSTMAIKSASKFPETGWGVAFATKFNDRVQVVNKAKNGRSTKSFIDEGIWKEIEEHMKPGDYVFIQFGHNDEKIEKPKVGTTIAQYKENLSLFVQTARSKQATPILMTPIARRSFIEGKLVDTHKGYPEAVREVADSLNVMLIDATKLTMAQLSEMGPTKSESWFLHLPAGHTNYPNGVQDNTHLNVDGAEQITALVVGEMKRQKMSLVDELK